MSNLRAVMADRAATNNAMVNLLTATRPSDNKVFKAKCNSHTVIKVGDKFEGAALKKVLSAWATAIMHPGHARECFNTAFSMMPALGNGVRWGVKHEQMAQLQEIGLESLRDKVIAVCEKNKWSEASSNKLVGYLNNPRCLSLAVTELAAQVNAGHIFVVATYTLESDAPMVLVAVELLDRLGFLKVLFKIYKPY
jgi:hypothetical protein